MYRGQTVSLVIPAYNEEVTISSVVEEFRQNPLLDEILVVDNKCTDRTAERARAAGARVISESTAGYGAALRAGLDAAKGDYLVLTEADGSFRGRDVEKLLIYLEDAQMVLGTRTTRQMVEQGANMGFALRWGNVFMAKFLELLWYFSHEPRFTDVGCSFRAVTARAWRLMRDETRETGPAFSPEMMCASLIAGCRVIEVPVTYSRRAGGDSKHSDTFGRQARTALSMFRTICRKRFTPKQKKHPVPAASQPGAS